MKTNRSKTSHKTTYITIAYYSNYINKKLESYLLKNIEMVIITSLSHPIRQRSTIVSTDDKKDLSPLHTTDEIYK